MGRVLIAKKYLPIMVNTYVSYEKEDKIMANEINEIVAEETQIIEMPPVEENKMSNKSKGVLIGVGLGGVGLGVGGTLIAQKVAPKIGAFFAGKLGKKTKKQKYVEIEEAEPEEEVEEVVEVKPVKAPSRKAKK